MVLRHFPALGWLKKQAESRFSNGLAYDGTRLKESGWPSVILHVETSGIFRDNIPGPLSLFSSAAGESLVAVGGKQTIVREAHFFMTNPGQRYTLEVDRKKTACVFNIHFGERWADDILSSLVTKTEALLDQPDTSRSSTEFYNRLYRKDDLVRDIQRKLVANNGESQLVEEQLLCDLLQHLLLQQHADRRSIKSLNTIKAATKEEIARRLFAAVDYIQSHDDQSVSLDELARVSCLSKFHFLRLFKIFFRQTPHEYVSRVRLERAASLLKHTDLEVKDIARNTGFRDASTFSRAFFQRHQVYPSQYRRR